MPRFDIAMGQYVPLDSPVHRLEARAKLLLTACFTASLFLVADFRGLLVLGAMVVAAVAASRVPVSLALRGVRAVGFVLALTIGLQALRWGATPDALVTLGSLAVSGEGLMRGLFFATRVILLVVGSALVTLTTSPVALTDAMERLMRPAGRVGLPTHELAMMLTIALRFIPTTAEEAQRIVMAQVARGARFDTGGPIRRARAWIPVLIPLLVTLFRRADTLATAMEARCYRGGDGRTRLHESVMRWSDAAVLAAGACILTGIAVAL